MSVVFELNSFSNKSLRISRILSPQRFNMYFKLLLIYFCMSSCVNGENHKVSSTNDENRSNGRFLWTHEISLENGMKIVWDATDDEWLTIQMSAPVKGYVGVGFSPNGGMAGSDIVIGWVDDNNIPHLKDYHAVSNAEPILDAQQDYELLHAEQNDHKTLIRFRRKWITCDKEDDFELGDDTVRLIWTFSDNDPKYGVLPYHGINRGTRSLFLKAVQRGMQFPDDYPQKGVQEWQVNLHKYQVPIQETTYHCRIFEFPSFAKKHHIIGYRPIIQKENRPYVHHATIFRCTVPPNFGTTHDVFEKYLNHSGGDCLRGEVPFEWNKYCYEFIIATAIGAEGEMFPDNVGIPMFPSEDGELNYIRFEIHYDNPGLRKIVDSSGIKIFYTEQLREHDIGVIYIGHRTSPFQVIPPNQENFTTYGFCPGSCTAAAFPVNGVKLFGTLLHAHIAGTAIRLKHIRNGVELLPIAEDKHYDFNYQQYRSLRKETTILPGDDLIVECDYSSANKRDSVIGGFPSNREMCASAIWIYPDVKLKNCRTQPEFHSFFKALDMEDVHHPLFTTLQLPINPENLTEKQWQIVLPDDSLTMTDKYPQFRNSENNPWREIYGKRISTKFPNYFLPVQDAIQENSWNKTDAKIMQDKWKNGLHYVFCSASGGERVPSRDIIQEFPKYETYSSEEAKTNCSKMMSSGTKGFIHSYISLCTLILCLTNLFQKIHL